MKKIGSCLALLAICTVSLALTSCANMSSRSMYASGSSKSEASYYPADYASRVPQQIAAHEKTVIVNPRVHTWAAYQNGQLVRAGLATAGSSYCPDLGRPCRTSVGSFRVYSLGTPECKSHRFPLPRGGAPMPYCMFFNSSQALHGSHSNEVVEGNISHGCVRMHVADAEWLRYNFVNVGTRVVVTPY